MGSLSGVDKRKERLRASRNFGPVALFRDYESDPNWGRASGPPMSHAPPPPLGAPRVYRCSPAPRCDLSTRRQRHANFQAEPLSPSSRAADTCQPPLTPRSQQHIHLTRHPGSRRGGAGVHRGRDPHTLSTLNNQLPVRSNPSAEPPGFLEELSA